MSTKYTQERLVLTSQDDYPTGCANFAGGTSVDAVVLYHPNAKADARRIVACWNAFEGMATDVIELLAQITTVKQLIDDVATLNGRFRAVQAERDRLLALQSQVTKAAVGEPCRNESADGFLKERLAASAWISNGTVEAFKSFLASRQPEISADTQETLVGLVAILSMNLETAHSCLALAESQGVTFNLETASGRPVSLATGIEFQPRRPKTPQHELPQEAKQ